MRFPDIAKGLVDRGIAVIPVRQNSKEPFTHLAPRGAQSATLDPAVLAQWGHDPNNHNLNCGAVARPDGYWFLDVDDTSILTEYLQETNQLSMPETYTVMASRGPHFYFRQNDKSRAMGNIVIPGKCEARVLNQYVVAAGSTHASGVQYRVVDDREAIEAPDDLIQWLRLKSSAASPSKGKPGEANPSSVQDSLRFLSKWATQYGIQLLEDLKRTDRGGIKAYVECPQKHLHTNDGNPSQSAILIAPDGVIAYRCQHSHCVDFLWKQYREHYEPGFSAELFESLTIPTPPPGAPNVTEPDTRDPLAFDRAALYGPLGALALKLKVPLGFAYPALITAFSVVVPNTLDVRTNHYCGLIGKVGENKGESFARASAALHVQVFRQNIVSDRGVEKAIEPAQGGRILIYQDEFGNALRKMRIENSALAHVYCQLWSGDEIGSSDKQGVHAVSARMSMLVNIPAASPSEFRILLPPDTMKGLYDRFIWGRADKGEIVEYSRFSKLGLDQVLTPAAVCCQVQDCRFDQMNEWIARKLEEYPELPRQGRLGEILLRVAVTLASANGETEMSDGAFAAAVAFCEWQYRIRRSYAPSQGATFSAQINEALLSHLTSLDGGVINRKVLQKLVKKDMGCGAGEYKREFDAAAGTGEIQWDRKQDLVRVAQ